MVFVDSPLNVGFSYTKVLPVPTPLAACGAPNIVLESIVPAWHVTCCNLVTPGLG
jgi:hypothetical protein